MDAGAHGGGHGAHSIGVPRALYEKHAPLLQPEVRRSANGVLSTTLRVGYAYKDIGGYRLWLRTYEGDIPGPTFCVGPGDTVRIKLINALPPNPDAAPADRMLPHHFNTSNLHFHGGHVDPGGISDNVFRSMLPGETYDIEIVIPKDHTRRTYWYQPHHHGSADVQITSGMAGEIIISTMPARRPRREDVPARGGAAGDDPQAGGRRTPARHPDHSGPGGSDRRQARA